MYRQFIFLLLLTSLTILAFAQSTYFFTDKKPQKSLEGGVPNNTVLTPSQFNDLTSQMTSTNQNNFDQQYKQNTAKIAPQNPSTSSGTGTAIPSTPATPTTNLSNTSTTAPAQPANQNVYTGFGDSTSSDSNTPKGPTTPAPSTQYKGSTQGGGWNIHY
jgi:hypothetical protein